MTAAQNKHTQVALALGALFILNLLLRVFYLRFDFVNGDEAVRAVTALRLLEGATLYVDVVTDKPPGATLFYALVFKLFGASMNAVHIAAAVWHFATALVLYWIGSQFYTRRLGLWAAALFVYFSTNYLTQDVMAANTELLMALPYTGSFYIFMKAHKRMFAANSDLAGAASALVAAGFLTGFAVIFKQVGVFNLLFFAASLGIAGWRLVRLRHELWPRVFYRVAAALALLAAGFSLPLLTAAVLLARAGALQGFWRNAVVLGAEYVQALPASLWLEFMVTRVGGYILFNLALWWLACWAIARAVWRRRVEGAPTASAADHPDLSVALWGVAAAAGVFAGGRFFGHYFITLLPALSLLGARGVELVKQQLEDPVRRKKARLIATALVFLIVFGVFRFHHRTAVLGYETVTGRRTTFSEAWGMTRRERDAAEVARFVRERIGEGEPLYIWGYALDVYWQSGARPASRYLTPAYVLGQFYPEVSGTAQSDEGFWAQTRAQLIDDLRNSRPRLILNTDDALLSLPYPDIVRFIKENYVYEGQIGSDPARPFLVFRLREKAKGKPRNAGN